MTSFMEFIRRIIEHNYRHCSVLSPDLDQKHDVQVTLVYEDEVFVAHDKFWPILQKYGSLGVFWQAAIAFQRLHHFLQPYFIGSPTPLRSLNFLLKISKIMNWHELELSVIQWVPQLFERLEFFHVNKSCKIECCDNKTH